MRSTGEPAGRPARAGAAERIAAWSAAHRRTAILGWLGLVLAAVVAGLAAGGPDAVNRGPGDGGRAETALDRQGEYLRYHENVLIQAFEPGGPAFADDPRLVAAAEDLVTELRNHPDAVREVVSPLETATHLSADHRSGLVSFAVNWPTDQLRAHWDTVTSVVGQVAARHGQVRVAQAGDRSLTSAVDTAVKADLQRSHLLSLPFVLIILLAVFGSLVAAGVPVLLTVTAIAGALGLITVLGKTIPINSAGSALILLIGVAVGVDYSLFYLRRYREERQAGRDDETALRITARTSGHVVLFSGVTVILCLAGLLFTGLGVFVGATIGLTLTVGMAMVGSVTVLPAVLAGLRGRIDNGRIPFLRRTVARESKVWSRIAHQVSKHPARWAGGGVLVLLMVATPALSMRLQDAAATDSLPRSVSTVDAAVRMREAFPGVPIPAQVVVWRKDGTPADGPEVRQGVERLRAQIAGSGGLLAEPITVDRVDRAVVVRVPLAGSSTDETSFRALDLLRGKAIPAAFGTLSGVDVAVAGKTAQAADFEAQLRENTWRVFVFVLSLAFVLLVFAFRSLWLPLVSILLNLLSIGAAYGVVTWIFQDGNLAPLLGFASYGGVMSWLPLFMFVVLFGLSMDYHLFILSRVRERWLAGESPRAAIVGGIGRSAGVVSGAATIMVVVFSVFVTLTSIENKMLGVGLAVAVALDATVVRGVLVPATLSLLGERAWRLPRWLEWLPGKSRS